MPCRQCCCDVLDKELMELVYCLLFCPLADTGGSVSLPALREMLLFHMKLYLRQMTEYQKHCWPGLRKFGVCTCRHIRTGQGCLQ